MVNFFTELIKAMTIDNSRSLGHSLLCLPSLSKGTPGASSKGTSGALHITFYMYTCNYVDETIVLQMTYVHHFLIKQLSITWFQ